MFTRVHAGHVWLNQNLILTPGSLNIGTQEVRIPIDLTEDTSTLSLKLKGFPGSFVKVSIYGEDSNQPPILNLTWSTDQPLEDEVVLFDAMASTDPDGLVTEVHFDWGDNTSSTGFVAEHSWQVAGVYVVTVTATDDDGAQTSVPIEYTVLPKPKPPTDGGGIFFVTTTDHVPTKALFFTLMPAEDQDGGQIVSYTWDFGIGKILTLYPHETDLYASVEHYYQNTGVYQVTLTITDDSGLSTSTSRQIEIVPNQPPVPHISVNQASGPAPLTVTFDASESFDPENDEIRYRWRFGDNSPEVIGTDQAVVSHTYSQPGTYTVRLRLRDQFLARREVTTQIVVGETDANVPPTPVLISSGLLGQSPFTVQLDASQSFDIDSGDSISQVEWTFGDDHDPIDFTQGAMTSHTFNYPGSYYGRLTVRDAQGKSSVEHFTVHVLSGDPAKVDFLAQANPSDPLELWFDNSVGLTTAPIEYHNFHWFYGDNSYARGRNQSHTYPGPGPYEVQLSAFDVLGQRYLTKKTVNVQHTSADLPVAIALDNYSPSVNEEIQIWLDTFDLNQIADFNLKWDLGDGTVLTGIGSDLHSISHTYAKSGLYKITLSLTNPENLTTRLETEINVYSGTPPLPLFIATPLVGQAPVEVSFNGSYTWDSDDQVTTWIWSWGDGQKSISGPYESHTYQEPGQYFPSLTVIDQAGNYATHTAEIRVLSAPPPLDNQPPVAEIVALTPTTGTAPLRVEVDAYNSYDPDGEIIEYRWDNSNGHVWTGPYYVDTFDQPGAHSIVLTVTDNHGKTASSFLVVTVLDPNPPGGDIVPNFISSPQAVYTGLTTTFSAVPTYNPTGLPLAYQWSFGDGGSGLGEISSHIFSVPGSKTVRLEVTDSSGAVYLAEKVVDVLPEPFPVSNPTIIDSKKYPRPEFAKGQVLNIDSIPAIIEFSSDDSVMYDDGTQAHWDFGDGTSSMLRNGQHVFETEGVFQVDLTMTSPSGKSDTASLAVVVAVNDVDCSFMAHHSTCFRVGDSIGNVIPTSKPTFRLRNNHGVALSFPEPSSSQEPILFVHWSPMGKPIPLDLTDIIEIDGTEIVVDTQQFLSKLDNLTDTYWFEIHGSNAVDGTPVVGATEPHYVGSSGITVGLPPDAREVLVRALGTSIVRSRHEVSGNVSFEDLPAGKYLVETTSPSTGPMEKLADLEPGTYAFIDFNQPGNEVSQLAQKVGAQETSFAALDSRQPSFSFSLPEYRPSSFDQVLEVVRGSTAVKSANVGLVQGFDIPPTVDFPIQSITGPEYMNTNMTDICQSRVYPGDGIIHQVGPHSNPYLNHDHYVSTDPTKPSYTDAKKIPPFAEEVIVNCNFQSLSGYIPYLQWYERSKALWCRPPNYDPATHAKQWYWRNVDINTIRGNDARVFPIRVNFWDPVKRETITKTIYDSAANVRARLGISSDEEMADYVKFPPAGEAGQNVIDWGLNWTWRVKIPKDLHLVDLDPNDNFDPRPYVSLSTDWFHYWEALPHRMSCHISWPTGPYPEIKSVEDGIGETTPVVVTASAQNTIMAATTTPPTPVYTPVEDSKRSLAYATGMFPVDVDESTHYNLYENHGGTWRPEYTVTLSVGDNQRFRVSGVGGLVGFSTSTQRRYYFRILEEIPSQTKRSETKVRIEVDVKNLTEHLNWAPLNQPDKFAINFFVEVYDPLTDQILITPTAQRAQFKASFNLNPFILKASHQRSPAKAFNFVPGVCDRKYGNNVSIFARRPIIDIVRAVKFYDPHTAYCNDASLPFGGKIPAHDSHKNGLHLDFRYHVDLTCDNADLHLARKSSCQQTSAYPNGFPDYYDANDAQERLVDLPLARRFLQWVNASGNSTLLLTCKDSYSACVAPQNFSPEDKEAFANGKAANFRLAHWTMNQRSILSSYVLQDKTLAVLVSQGVYANGNPSYFKRWQEKLLFDGKVDNFPLLEKTTDGRMEAIGTCSEDLNCKIGKFTVGPQSYTSCQINPTSCDLSETNVWFDPTATHLTHFHLHAMER
ncbi:MAG: PKD domain-containing protein [Bdellovibrionaceae bacterium]|nr:PKD domain-containing protein [Pseudobdellovibrionaceae bacterium]